MNAPVAHVVGAGIAGLATAVALSTQGWSVRVFERSAGLRTTGGGIGITPNGMVALRALGVGAAVRARSVVQHEGGVRAPSGRWIARSALGFVEQRYGEAIRALPRIELVRLLEAALPEGTVRYAARAVLVATGGATGRAVIEVDGEVSEADLVVGADGIRSATRRILYPAHPGLRSCGSVSWRAMVSATGLSPVPAETWGAGLRFSILPLPAGRVHFSALARSSVARAAPDGVAGVRTLFGGWHDPVPELIARVPDNGLFRDEIEEIARPLDTFSIGRVVLVGDAAHPMSPNVGAANVALEDAVELAAAVRAGDEWTDLAAGLRRYDAVRRPRSVRLGRMARRAGRLVEVSAPFAVVARNSAVWLGGFLPEVVSRRSMDAMVRWSPPMVAGQVFGVH